MAELADAHGSGPCDSNIMRVQVPFPALKKAKLYLAFFVIITDFIQLFQAYSLCIFHDIHALLLFILIQIHIRFIQILFDFHSLIT